jgi:hypothetical protein
MTTELRAAQRLLAAPSNTLGGIRAEVVRQLKAGRYQVQTTGDQIKVLNGSPQNVAGALKYQGWTFDRYKNLLTHPQLDYRIKLSSAGDTTTLHIFD